MRIPALLSGLLGLSLCACGGAQKAAHEDTTAKSAEMRAKDRAERRRIRDLSNQVALLKQRLAVQGTEVRDVPAPPPLPVEVYRPDDVVSEQVEVGLADDDVEVVYVGEASAEGSYRPPLAPDALVSDRVPEDDAEPESEVIKLSNRHLDAPKRSSETKALTPIPSLPTGADLGVTDSAGPTVAAVTRAVSVAAVTPKKVEAKKKIEAPVPKVSSIADPVKDYQRYLQALKNKNHAFAIVGFENFLARYPNHDYADNALYWLGEAFYDQKKYAEAKTQFERVYVEYPGGNKVPSALLKAAYCHMQLGATDKARDVLQRVIALYPNTGPSRLAEQRLAEIK